MQPAKFQGRSPIRNLRVCHRLHHLLTKLYLTEFITKACSLQEFVLENPLPQGAGGLDF